MCISSGNKLDEGSFLVVYPCMGAVDTIVPFHKSQCALRYLDPMSKIQNTSSQRSLATWLTVTANEQNDDWPALSALWVFSQLSDDSKMEWLDIGHT